MLLQWSIKKENAIIPFPRAEALMSVTGHRSFKTMKRSQLPTNRNATP